MKEKFTPEEWHLLKLLPFLAYSFVADSLREVKRMKLDGALEILRTWLAHPGGYTDALHRQVALDTPQSEWAALLAESQDPMRIEASVVEGAPPPEGDRTLAIISRLLKIRGILSARLILEQYESFVTSVLTISADAPFRSVPRKGRARADEAISTVAGMLLQDPSSASATVSVSQRG